MTHQFHTATDENSSLEDCVATCFETHAVCMHTMNHCIDLGGENALPNHIRSLLDCAEFCQVNANFLIRESENSPRVSQLCAELCIRCAESCESVETDDEMIEECAETCRRCAEACQEIARESVAA